ncbi:MAG TPA: AI-2E family transporter [Gemmatimonadaceae bacterium]|nr:AI-2E family transporter [Gemmatimonadaceae bacterium]
MTELARPTLGDRRRTERRTNQNLAELTLPEFRRMLVTTTLFVIVLVLFLWMVRTVIIATILGVVVAVYLRPVYLRILGAIPSKTVSATVTLLILIVPVIALLIYSYLEIADVATYVDAHRTEIAARIDVALHRLPFMQNANTGESVERWVVVASNYGTSIPNAIRAALGTFAIAATIFVFTAFYFMVDAERIGSYLRSKIAPRYQELMTSLEENVRGVLYGAIYSTFLTQAIKSVIILLMNLAFHVPLAGVLAILSFIIGFFPIVGSWSVYLPVACWLAIFRNAPGQAVIMLVIGFFVNTIYISTFLRPKIAAERSKVLNFYWMLVGLVTGVYTFGLVGILLGPIVIGLLKAILDTITTSANWRLVDADGDGLTDDASDSMP